MMTKAILKSKKSIDGFLIPQQAVLRDQKANPIVTLVTPENKTITKIVKIERSVGNKWLILDGLEESDKIVVEGLNKINSRSVVSLKDLNSQYKD
jgi:membrane fusion protein (multidrug efflux system)